LHIFKNYFTKYGQLNQEIIKIIAIRLTILRLRCIKIDFGWGSAPELAEKLTEFPTPFRNIRDLLLREGEGAGKGRGGEGDKEG